MSVVSNLTYIFTMINFSLLLFIIVTFTGLGIDGQQFRCDYTYHVEAGGWFKLHILPAEWNEARAKCSLEGAVLASPLNANITESMERLIKNSEGIEKVFTGIHATFSKGDYFSIEGIPLNKISHKWAKNEPDNYNNKENCIAMMPYGHLADENCDRLLPYICYKEDKKADLPWNQACGTTDLEYKFNVTTGHCYKFHREPRTWSKGFSACAAEGGYLAIINSDEEAETIRGFLKRYPPESIIGNFQKIFIFMGFHDWNEHGAWKTIHGQTLSEAGYDKFQPGQPDNAAPGEHCGAIFRTALLDDLWCDRPYNFICEKEPNSLLCSQENLQ